MEMNIEARSLNDLYPPSPEGVPENFTKPTSSYRRHAWLAVGGLFIFVLFYLGLTVWFSWSAFRLSQEVEGFFDIVKVFCAVVLAVFLVKSLFFNLNSGQMEQFELKEADEPELFAFIHRIADETGAPRPHKVFLSPEVNAAVFYDLTMLNLLFPSRKNLLVGLGLVNVLNLSEFKAVLAHEFGHFAQRSMAVGRYVYTAQRIAQQLIGGRDFFDDILSFISSIDLRIAWIGWLLRIIVWAIRAVLDSLFHLVMLAERALSREMEFQADLVAVSITGSDALVHGLYVLPAADGAWNDTKNFVTEELRGERSVSDLFQVMDRILIHQRRILDEPEHAKAPALPATEERAAHRVFTAEMAEPPQMWATHPHNHLREANAKQTYIPAVLDQRSAWELFRDPEDLSQRLSAHLLEGVEIEPAEMEVTLHNLDIEYDKEYYSPRYRGVYLGRSVVESAKIPRELYHMENEDGLLCEYEDLYPENLSDELEHKRNLDKEHALLVSLRDRTFEPPDGVIRFRDDIIKRSGLGDAIAEVKADADECEAALIEHDRHCRGHHYSMARAFSKEWAFFHEGVLSVLHYAEHSIRNMVDANQKFVNTVIVVMADGKVTEEEMTRLLTDGQTVYRCIQNVYEQAKDVHLDEFLRDRLEAETSWEATLDPLKLPRPTRQNISDWYNAYEGWVGHALDRLSRLREESLEQLLALENELARCTFEGEDPGEAPVKSRVPNQYRTLTPGEERELQTKLNWWDSFQTASGTPATLARLAASLAIVLGSIWLTFPQGWLRVISGWFR